MQDCSTCINNIRVCLYSKPIKKRGPSSAHFNLLVDKVHSLEEKLCSNTQPQNDQHETKIWSNQSFVNQNIESKLCWTIYFENVNPRLTLFQESWFMAHMLDLPLPLLHIMYGLCFVYPGNPNPDAEYASYHFKLALQLLEPLYNTPDPFIAASCLLLSCGYSWRLMVSHGSAIFAFAVRLCQLVGIDKDTPFDWSNHTFAVDYFDSQQICRSIWCLCTIGDYQAHACCAVPFLIPSMNIQVSWFAEMHLIEPAEHLHR